MGRTATGDTVRLWAAARKGYWHAAYTGERRVTTEPIPADAIPALLGAWGVEATSWITWAAPWAKSRDQRKGLAIKQPFG